MRLRAKHVWFLAFTAVFAVLAGFVFWGTWSLGVAPVMPDCPVSYPDDFVANWIGGWLRSGKFVPDDLKVFLGTPYLWTELQYALAAYCAALGLVYYCRGRGLSRPAAYGAGLLLAFCGYWFTLFSAGHLGWFRWMTYGVFAFGLADRAVRKGKPKNWLLLGATVAWASFYQPDLWLLFTLLTGAYFVWCCVRERKAPWRGALLAAAAFFLIGAPSFRSALVNDLAGRDKQIVEGQTVGGAVKDDAEKRWIFVTNWSLPPSETAEFLLPRLNGDTSCPFTLALGRKSGSDVRSYAGALGRPLGAPSGNYRQHSLYVGFVTCLLAVLGLACRWRTREVLFFAVAAFVCWLCSMGRNFEPVYRIVYALPFGDYLRAPVKWHHLTEFCLCVLAAYGIEAALGMSAKLGRRAFWAVLGVVLLGVADLVRVDRLYCAPQDVKMDYTFVSSEQAKDPRFEPYVKSLGGRLAGRVGDLVCLAVPKKPQQPAKDETPVPATVLTLGILSALATVAVGAYGVKKS